MKNEEIEANKNKLNLKNLESENSDGDKRKLAIGGIAAAAVSKTVVAKSAFFGLFKAIQSTVVAITKPLLQWWFRTPVKLFRPTRVDPWGALRTFFAAEGINFSEGSFRTWFASESGLSRSRSVNFVRSNIVPLLVANSLCGMLLFQGYSAASFVLQSAFFSKANTQYSWNSYWKYLTEPKNAEKINPETRAFFPLYKIGGHNFVAGMVGGAAQGLLAAPWDVLRHRVEQLWTVEKSIKECVYQAVKENKSTSLLRTVRHGLGFIVAKDALTFGTFFGAFETSKIFLKRQCHDHLRENDRIYRAANVSATVLAGAFAGMAYQAVAYPIGIVQSGMPNSDLQAFKVEHLDFEHSPQASFRPNEAFPHSKSHVVEFSRTLVDLVKTRGVFYLYKGITPTLLRAIPPSSIGLLMFEFVNNNE